MSITAESRTVLKLVLVRGKSYREIGDLLGIEEPAARARAHQALAELSVPGEPALDGEVCDVLLGQADPITAAALARQREGDPELAERIEVIEEQLRLVAPRRTVATPDPALSPAADVTHPETLSPAAGGKPAPVRDSTGTPGFSSQLTAAQRRLVALLLGAALLAVILVLILTGVIGGSDDKPDDGSPPPTTARLEAVPGESGEGTAQIGFNSQGGLAANLQVSGLEPNRRNQTYAIWFYGSKGAFPVNQSRVGESGELAGQIALNEAVICLIAADVFPEIRVSRVSQVQMNRSLRAARRANGGSGRIPDYAGETVLTGQISMPQEAKDQIVPGCTGATQAGSAG